jgi:hypothetical protein
MPYRKSKLTPEMSYYPLRGEDQSGGMESMEQERAKSFSLGEFCAFEVRAAQRSYDKA